MKAGKKHFFILVVLALLGGACEKVWMDDLASDDPVKNFEYLWKTLDEKYVFFEYKDINWDSIYHEFRPQVTHAMKQEDFFYLMDDLLFLMKDGHVNLYSQFGSSRSHTWFMESPLNFNRTNIFQTYLGIDASHSGPFVSQVIDSVAYIYYESFSSEIKANDIDALIRDYSDLNGIIIDVRSNGGGSSRNGRILASRFADKTRHVSNHLYKRGPAHDDFHEPFAQYLSPEGAQQFLKPVVILMNRFSYSATNDFILKMSALPHVTLMGDKSGGGGGIPVDKELPNGWLLRYSATMTLDPEGFNVEHGIQPDVRINLRVSFEVHGRDNILEYAIRYINESSP